MPLHHRILEDESGSQVLGGYSEPGIVGLAEKADVFAYIAAEYNTPAAHIKVLLVALGAEGILGPISPKLALKTKSQGHVVVFYDDLCGDRHRNGSEHQDEPDA